MKFKVPKPIKINQRVYDYMSRVQDEVDEREFRKRFDNKKFTDGELFLLRKGWDAGYAYAYSEIECVMKKPKKGRK